MAFQSSDGLSSPDPLNDSGIFTSPEKTTTRLAKTPRRKASSKARRRVSLPMNTSSPNKQTFELAVGDGISPQKLFVTVEAASKPSVRKPARRSLVFPSPNRPDVSPSRTMQERTTTTTIPLKGLSDTDDWNGARGAVATPKRGRGRPRKSSTPVPKKIDGKRVSLGDFDMEDDDEDIWDLARENGAAARKGKGRARSRSATKKATTKKAKATPTPSQGNVSDAIMPKRGRGRPRKAQQEESTVLAGRESHEGDELGAPEFQSLNATTANADYTAVGDGDTYQNHPDVSDSRFDENMETPREDRRKSRAEEDAWAEDDAEADLYQAEGFEGPMDYSPDREAYGGTGSPRSNSREADAPQFDERNELEGGEDDYLPEAGDNAGELREFDTIMESEDFSMISVDSLRGHITPQNASENAAPKLSDIAEVSSEAGKAVEPVSAVAQRVPKAFGARKEQTPLQAIHGKHLVPQEDSFSSIAQSILDAVSPIKGGRADYQHALTLTGPSEQSGLAGPSLRSGPNNGRLESRDTPDVSQSNTNAEFQDPDQPQSRVREFAPIEVDTIMTDLGPLDQMANTPRPSSGRPSSHWSGLATPRESKSPYHESNGFPPNGSQAAANEAERMDEGEDEDTHMDSSPPYVRTSPAREMQQEKMQKATKELQREDGRIAHIRQPGQSDMVETPGIVLSSPNLPPLIQQAVPARTEQLAPNKTRGSNVRPPLSSIARTGLVLQDVVVAPSSPRTRSQSLASPFTSPFKSRAGSISPVRELPSARGPSQVNDRRLSNFDLFSNMGDDARRDVSEPSRQGKQINKTHRPPSSWSIVHPKDDPFRTDGRSEQRPSSSADKSRYSLTLPGQGRVPYPSLRKSQTRIQDGGSGKLEPVPITEDVFLAAAQSAIDRNMQTIDAPPLSWAGKDISLKGKCNLPATHAQRLEREWANEREAVSKQIDAASTSQVIVLSSEKDDVGLPDGRNQDGDEDIDIWQDEARNLSSMIGEKDGKQFSAGKQPFLEKPRRGQIPSSWHKNSMRLVHNYKLADASSAGKPLSKEAAPPEQPEKAVERQFSERKQTALESSHFGSDSQDFTGLWQTEMPVIPQKANFKPRPRMNASQLEFSRFFDPSPRKSLPTPTSSEPTRSSKRPAAAQRNTTTRYSSPLVTAANNKLNVSTSKALPTTSSSSTTEQRIGFEQEDDLSRNNENFGSDTEIPEDQSTPARTTTKSKSRSTPKTAIPPLKSIVQSSMAVSNPAAPPQPSIKTESESPFLSPTEWSKSHWRLLNKILQAAKPLDAREVFSLSDMFVTEEYFVGFEVDRDRDGWVRSELLGKELTSSMESMVLEQWHLEVLAVFREVVGWGDERAVAKRLFGLVGAEERRRARASARSGGLGVGVGAGVVQW